VQKGQNKAMMSSKGVNRITREFFAVFISISSSSPLLGIRATAAFPAAEPNKSN
jgi:hypothetical protein